MNEHIEERIAAYLDGELSETEATAVSSHAEACDRCTRALREARKVHRLLDGDEAAQPLASMWPEVESRLRRRAPMFDLPFATATAAALAAGVMLGVLTFDRAQEPVALTEVVSSSSDTWSTDGELLLSDIYLSDPTDNGGTP